MFIEGLGITFAVRFKNEQILLLLAYFWKNNDVL